MLIQISHQTQLQYSTDVSLSTHKLYLIPQHRPYFRIEHQKFHICPEPEGDNFRQDLAGNWYKQCWFSAPTSSLHITGEWIFKIHHFNPFGFIIDREFEERGWEGASFQFGYEDRAAFLVPFFGPKSSQRFEIFLQGIKDNSESLVDFLVQLTREISLNWDCTDADEDGPRDSDYIFLLRNGTRRDLAVIQMEMLRELGLAARFVSGYVFVPDLTENFGLHAWVEVYLPGAGWVGLDPSSGLFTDHRYIPLASHPDPLRILPVQGSATDSAPSEVDSIIEMKLLHQGR